MAEAKRWWPAPDCPKQRCPTGKLEKLAHARVRTCTGAHACAREARSDERALKTCQRRPTKR